MMRLYKRADAPAAPTNPLPRVLSPSGSFDGNDGKWSTFVINIAGDGAGKGQNFKVVPSTSWKASLVPARADWCNTSCAASRGVMNFNGAQPLGLADPPAVWKEIGTYEFPFPPWWSTDTMMLNFPRGPGVYYGRTNIGLNQASASSITFPGQAVASYIGEDFYLGVLGLAAGTASFSTNTVTTFFSTFAASNQTGLDIPSPSYGYTAGAWYRNNKNGTPGNMVFGGYDQTRVTPGQGTVIPMPSKSNNTLIVGVQSMLYRQQQTTGSGTHSFTANPDGTTRAFAAIIDSSIPYLVLPNSICDDIALHFQLTYDSNLGLYLVNDTAHDFNTQQNATVSFKIGKDTTDSNNSTDITLPYPAFDLQISSPIVNNTQNYFPIRRGNNGPYVLGRTFLQESYIIVDYDRTTVTVAPALFPEPLPAESLVPIYKSSYVAPKPISPHQDGLSAGAIAGIVIGIVAAFLLLGLAAFFFWKRKRNTKDNAYSEEDKPSEIDTTAAGSEIRNRRVSELTGSEVPSSPGTTINGTYYGGDLKKYPAIAEMSPDSQPAELYSPPPGNENDDYFAGAPRPRRRGATRDSSGHNTPRTPVAELAGDFGQYEAVSPLQRPQHSRSPSDTSLTTNIDEVLAGNDADAPQVHRKGSSRFIEHTGENEIGGPSRAEQVISPLEDPHPTVPTATEHDATLERRPSHTRGLSDTTVNSESTAVSQPTAEELARWNGEGGARRPLSQ